MGFVVDKIALGQVFSEYFRFPSHSSFHQILLPHNLPGAEMANVPNGLKRNFRWIRDLVSMTELHLSYQNFGL
jgi:hypothetical protein